MPPDSLTSPVEALFTAVVPLLFLKSVPMVENLPLLFITTFELFSYIEFFSAVVPLFSIKAEDKPLEDQPLTL